MVAHTILVVRGRRDVRREDRFRVEKLLAFGGMVLILRRWLTMRMMRESSRRRERILRRRPFGYGDL
jgi:hypothetical protein